MLYLKPLNNSNESVSVLDHDFMSPDLDSHLQSEINELTSWNLTPHLNPSNPDTEWS